jgi:hypothetical protein
MKRGETDIIRSVLKDEIGPVWFLLLIRSVMKKGRLLRGTKWSHDKSAEGKFARRLSILASLYLVLREKYDRGVAFRIMSRIIVPTGCCEQWQNLKNLKVENKRGYERLKAFYDFMGEGGSGQFVERRLSSNTSKLVQYEVRDCLFARFFAEMGMLEIASLFCKIDRSFFPTAIPDYGFSRGDSWENSAAYGKDHCVFRFEKMDRPFDEAYLGETPLLDYTKPEIQMLYEQLDLSYKSDEEKVGHFYEYVKGHMKTGRFGVAERPASTVKKKGRGNDLDKTVLFMALLRAAGIPCRARIIKLGVSPLPYVEVLIKNKWLPVQKWTDGRNGAPVVDSIWLDDAPMKNGRESGEEYGTFTAPDDYFRTTGK